MATAWMKAAAAVILLVSVGLVAKSILPTLGKIKGAFPGELQLNPR